MESLWNTFCQLPIMNRMIIVFFLFSFSSFSQSWSSKNIGLSTGVTVNFWTHVNSVGLILKTYYSDYFYQINIGSSITWNFQSYGNRKMFWENRTYLGLALLGGKKDNSIDFQLDGLAHQTVFRNAVSFNYLWYFDNVGTSQRSGGFGLSINKVNLFFENDVFGGQANDRFRTGHFFASYRYENFKFGSGIYLWTGETEGTPWKRECSENCPNGFKDLSNLPYGKTSHGILYGSVLYNLPFRQNAFLKIGLDSEHIRHGVQNKLIHDLIFIPKKIERKTPHYPRLNEDGFPVFEKNKTRKNKFYLQSGLNDFMQ